jgi:uncharacterized protein
MTQMGPIRTFTAFVGPDTLEAGAIEPVVRAVKAVFDRRENTPSVLVFEDATGKQVDFDLEGSPELVVERLGWHPLFRNPDDLYPRGRGRPRLGVVSREISLFPRHWDWLERQPQGASAAIRRLVEEALAREPDQGKARRAREAAGTFMWAMAGNLAHFEEASRALYAGDNEKLDALMSEWPQDVRSYVKKLLAG